jgi:predicted DNA-binding transcriptional regulator AlpA
MSTRHSKHNFHAEWLSTSDLSNTRLKNRARPPIFAVSEVTIWRWVKKGYLPEPVKIGGKCFWSAVSVAELIQRRGSSDLAEVSGSRGDE